MTSIGSHNLEVAPYERRLIPKAFGTAATVKKACVQKKISSSPQRIRQGGQYLCGRYRNYQSIYVFKVTVLITIIGRSCIGEIFMCI